MGEIIDGELSCNNCVEKTRCKQQQKTKKQRIDAILSYITNEYNKKYIAELKNEIPAITRCDVILEKQLKRLEQENARLKEKLKKIKEYAETALKANYCDNCDGAGLPDCGDYECHTYALDKIMNIIEGAEE